MQNSIEDIDENNKKGILLILSIAQFFGLALWFAPNAVIDQMKTEFDLNNTDLSSLSIAVTLGFVIGGLTFSILNLPDLLKAKNFFFISSSLGGLANLSIVFVEDISFIWILILRFITGVFLAGIYPVGMKITASHFKHNRGLAVGILLSALTAGSGLPYLFNLFGTPKWEIVLSISSILAIFGGIVVL
ncbi:MAG: MFS transporter, partial [Candidatus Kariarchaeaceae archaeon]